MWTLDDASHQMVVRSICDIGHAFLQMTQQTKKHFNLNIFEQLHLKLNWKIPQLQTYITEHFGHTGFRCPFGSSAGKFICHMAKLRLGFKRRELYSPGWRNPEYSTKMGFTWPFFNQQNPQPTTWVEKVTIFLGLQNGWLPPFLAQKKPFFLRLGGCRGMAFRTSRRRPPLTPPWRKSGHQRRQPRGSWASASWAAGRWMESFAQKSGWLPTKMWVKWCQNDHFAKHWLDSWMFLKPGCCNNWGKLEHHLVRWSSYLQGF